MEGSRKDAWREKVCVRELRWEVGAGGVRKRRKKYGKEIYMQAAHALDS